MKKKHQKTHPNYLIIFLILVFSALLYFIFSYKDFVSTGHQNERQESTKKSKKEFKDAYSFFFNTDFIPNKKIIKVVAGDSLQKILLKEKISKEEIKNKKKLKIFIQVNLAKEENKNGVSINDLSNLYEQSVKEFNLNIIGLMCIPPNNLPVSNFFKELKDLNSKFNLIELSMGMSQDYLEAANAGATYLRIGSGIFGSRI